ncbi:MAG: hypothetical protein ACP5C3_07335 [Methanomicrobiales archaeon]
MNCGFFCDTGVIIGLSDKLDFHHKSCQFFFSKYPLESFEYFVSKTAVDELNNFKYKLTKMASERPMEKLYFNYIRLVQQAIDLYLNQMNHYECSYGLKNDLNNIIICIQPIIGFETINQQNDIKITANAIIWAFNSNYANNYLLTVDNKDIYRNKEKIVNESEKKLGVDLNINFLYLPYFKK